MSNWITSPNGQFAFSIGSPSDHADITDRWGQPVDDSNSDVLLVWEYNHEKDDWHVSHYIATAALQNLFAYRLPEINGKDNDPSSMTYSYPGIYDQSE